MAGITWYTVYDRNNCLTGNSTVRDPGVIHKYVNQITLWDVKTEIQAAECEEVLLLYFASVGQELE